MITPISQHWILILGFTAQLVFAARIVVQWWITEKNKHVESPTSFWILSLIGSSMLLAYGIIRHDVAIVVGQFIGYLIYVRNLQLTGFWKKIILVGRVLIVMLPLVAVAITLILTAYRLHVSFFDSNPQVMLGIVGQLLFNLRFLYQLYYAEKNKHSILPSGFWWISISGAILTLIYAIFRHDPVLIVAQGFSLIPYLRNIIIGKINSPAVEQS